jgi:hypothetical protein
MSDCAHDWNATSALRLVVETGHELFASIIPMAPTLLRIDYCRGCGALRINPEDLLTLRAAEEDAKKTAVA